MRRRILLISARPLTDGPDRALERFAARLHRIQRPLDISLAVRAWAVTWVMLLVRPARYMVASCDEASRVCPCRAVRSRVSYMRWKAVVVSSTLADSEVAVCDSC